MTNVVVWSTITSLLIEVIELCVHTKSYSILMIIYGMGSLIMFVCTYFMYDFSRKRYTKVCSCCDTAWSRCCSTLSKRAIQGSMMRELCWVLHGDNCTGSETKRYSEMMTKTGIPTSPVNSVITPAISK